MTTPVPTRVPVLPVVAAGVAGQLADDLLFVFLPSFPGAAAILAIVLTAGAARLVTAKLHGAAVPRAGLAVGAVSAGVGLLLSGLGLVSIIVAGLTVLAGVGGAILGRPEVRPHRD
ncbi:hypothetical protein GCM10010472_36120 [Pseudonocardia halophobica]|uniref:Uncharacterized protein n=1 Tax=Pseudonocardia halophobica TaxID=29401 RepID=A0A9W6L7M1_9PSEU|nr:hypothetical protein [Pseudonocardia halophobica]GLL14598.1 hypothetical protein GCM10017577_57460 [Pseudonocardia halophobica]